MSSHYSLHKLRDLLCLGFRVNLMVEMTVFLTVSILLGAISRPLREII